LEPYWIALLVLLAFAVAAVLFTVAVVVAVDRTVNRERRGTAGLAGRDAGEVEPDGNDAPGAGRAGGKG
jgi:hypothetical protein